MATHKAREVELSRGEFFRLDGSSRGNDSIQIKIRKGVVWVTHPEDGRDLIIQEGDSVRLKSGRGILIEAIGNSPANFETEIRSA